MKSLERRWYVFCKEVIPLLVTLGVVLEPIVYSDKVSDVFFYADAALFCAGVLIYFIGGFYFVRKRFTTWSNYLSVTKRTFIAETILCLFGVLVAYVMKDQSQYYVLAVWWGLSLGIEDYFGPKHYK